MSFNLIREYLRNNNKDYASSTPPPSPPKKPTNVLQTAVMEMDRQDSKPTEEPAPFDFTVPEDKLNDELYWLEYIHVCRALDRIIDGVPSIHATFSERRIVCFIKTKKLPDNFKLWNLYIPGQNLTAAYMATIYDILPEDFDRWEIVNIPADQIWRPDNFIETVAHRYVCRKKLPLSFNQWSLKDSNGRTVAHVAAAYGRLPRDFHDWDLVDNDGLTVASCAIYHNQLPDNFKDWTLCNENGDSMLYLYLQKQNFKVEKDVIQTLGQTPSTRASKNQILTALEAKTLLTDHFNHLLPEIIDEVNEIIQHYIENGKDIFEYEYLYSDWNKAMIRIQYEKLLDYLKDYGGYDILSSNFSSRNATTFNDPYCFKITFSLPEK